jgi:uncharacterized membrane protein YtjA (UPF0391 family)
MIRWVIFFLLLAVSTALFGFLGIAEAVAGISKFLFMVSIVGIVSLLAGPLMRPPKA